MANRFLNTLELILHQIRLNGGKELLTMDDTALLLGISKSHLYKLTSQRMIPHFKPTGKIVLFKRAELLDWVEKGRVSTQQELLPTQASNPRATPFFNRKKSLNQQSHL
ncbi:MAG: DNA-binding protein [Sphingobacteriales bacterium]|nr:MAG: DNA-binding protein [Sphingobacteriales bacterium]